MFITCQECNTTFRLDENLLKPTGSKVRCSQCRHLFVAYPPMPESLEAAPPPPEPMEVPSAVDEPPSPEPEAPAEEQEQELEGIDLAELDSILEGGAITDEAAGDESGQPLDAESIQDEEEALPELDDDDLNLDFDAALALDEEDQAGEPALEIKDESEEIDLDMDFSLEDDLPPLADELASEAPEPEEELTLDEEPQPGGSDDQKFGPDLEGLSLKSEDVQEKADDDLDLGNLDFDLDEEIVEREQTGEEPELSLDDGGGLELEGLDTGTEETAAEDGGVSEDLELDLALEDDGLGMDLEPEQTDDTPPAGGLQPEPELSLESSGTHGDDDIDLSDLDSLLEGGGDSALDQPEDSDDLELDLEMEGGSGTAAEPDAPVDEELEDLEFELDTEFTDEPAAGTAPVPESEDTIGEEDEIDLSDIEQMLEGGGAAASPVQPEAAEDDLGLGIGDAEDEIDLGEIESAIESADQIPEMVIGDEDDEEPELELDLDSNNLPPTEEPSDGLELDLAIDEPPAATEDDQMDLELELEMESDATPAEEAPIEAEEEEELDLSDLSELVDEPQAKRETIDSGDIELEFEIEEEEDRAPAAQAVSRTAGAAPPVLPLEETVETFEPPAAEEKPAKKVKAPRPKKKTSKTLLVLFFLILLGGLGYGAYYAVTELGIEIPYVSDYLNPKPQDPNGTLNLSTMDINSKFIENNLSGRLFVITGKVRNGYRASREKIRLQGKLYTKGKVLVKTEYSYAGVTLDDKALASLPIAQIKQRLTAVPKVQAAATIVRPGQALPFMVVFSDLPPADQLDEFAIEIMSSVQSR